jgi:hypothetical protein
MGQQPTKPDVLVYSTYNSSMIQRQCRDALNAKPLAHPLMLTINEQYSNYILIVACGDTVASICHTLQTITEFLEEYPRYNLRFILYIQSIRSSFDYDVKKHVYLFWLIKQLALYPELQCSIVEMYMSWLVFDPLEAMLKVYTNLIDIYVHEFPDDILKK